jgi:tRNA-dihydrouridine synthase
MQNEPRLRQLQQGLDKALSEVQGTYHDLRQAADWLEDIARLLDPKDKPERTGKEVQEQLVDYVETIQEQGQDNPVLNTFTSHIDKTTHNYTPGLFYTYDIEDVPRTNNDRESEFRGIIRHVLKTTGQKGETRRIILRSGAWEAIPHPTTIEQTIEALSDVAPEELQRERERVRTHRKRFKTHTRSVKQSQKQLKELQKQWAQLANRDG